MDYSKDNLKHEIKKTNSLAVKQGSRSVTLTLKCILTVVLIVILIALAFVIGAIKGIIDDLPPISEDLVSPKGLASIIYDCDGNEIQKLVGSGANRTIVSSEEIPKYLKDAFVSIEDERFYIHEGIDIKGILRAAFIGLSSGFNFTEGASTLTQQLIKNNVLSGGSEKTTGARFVRKIQEQYLALELEKHVDKDVILTDYLNTINLGANCLGVEKAAERYFNKSVRELTLSESAVIAAITQNPYAYNPIRFPEKNSVRMQKVLKKMEEQGFISAEEKQAALADNVYERIAEVNMNYKPDETVYSYFVDRLLSDLKRDLQDVGYSEEQATEMIYSRGLKIYSTQDSEIQAIVDKEVSDESNYSGIAQKYSFTYSLRIAHADGTYTDYSTNDIKKYSGRNYLDFDSKSDIQTLVDNFRDTHMYSDDKVVKEKVDISLQPQVSLTVMDQHTGQVRALSGGRGEKTTSLSLNRATGTFRQPGSTFKVLASFAPAIESKGATLASTYYDEPYSMTYEGSYWAPKNWYSSNTFLGYSNIRQGITYSMNIVAVRCLMETVGVEDAYKMVESFGINTLIPKTNQNAKSGKNDLRPTLALGGITQGVTNMQLTAAYATIANQGNYIEPALYTKVTDDKGNIIIEKNQEKHRTISVETAYLLTSAMSDSIERKSYNGIIDSNSPEAKPSKMPAAGKSGTTNSYNDLWFVGYTPYYTMGVWSGYDDNAKFNKSDNRDFHKEMWKKIMDQINEGYEVKEFEKPEDIVECEICTKSGLLATASCHADGRSCTIAKELFVDGTQPTENCNLHTHVRVCNKTGLLAGPNCKDVKDLVHIKLPEGSNSSTSDSHMNGSFPTGTCTQCLPEQPTVPTNPSQGTVSGDNKKEDAQSGSNSAPHIKFITN